MKSTYLFLSLFILFSVCSGQENVQQELSQKFKESIQMKRTGFYLIGAGAVVEVAGIYLFVKGMDEIFSDMDLDLFGTGEDQEENKRKFGDKTDWGIVVFIVGNAVMGSGFALASIGGSKSKKYRRMMKTKPNEIKLGFSSKGFGLYYNF